MGIWKNLIEWFVVTDPAKQDALTSSSRMDSDNPYRVLLAATRNIVVVPDLSAAELIAAARQECRAPEPAPQFDVYHQWDFYTGIDGIPISGRGKTFEVLTWEPDRDVTYKEVRKYFKAKGFYGHTGAFLAWVKRNQSTGSYVSILDDNALRGFRDQLCAPYAEFYGGSTPGLRIVHIDRPWRVGMVFIAFRELQPSVA